MGSGQGQWKYRFRYFDQDLAKGRFDNVSHTIVKFENESPVVTASSFFSAAPFVWGCSFAGVILNVIPMTVTETAVVLSYAASHSGPARKLFAPIKLEKDPARQKLLLSQLIVNKCENFFIRPSVVQGWGDEKRRFIEIAYQQSVMTEIEVELDSKLMLFP